MTEDTIVWALGVGAAIGWAGLAAWFVVRVWPRTVAGKLFFALTVSVLVPVAFVAGLLYLLAGGALFWDPDERFYRSEFEKVSRQPFPESGVFTATYASAPDFRGEYESCGAFTVSPADYGRLEAALPDDGLELPRWHGTSACDRIVGEAAGSELVVKSEHHHPESDIYHDWGVLSDGESVVFVQLTH